MAVRGRFGRRRTGQSQNLTAFIAALMREQRAAEDRQMFDAYKNGGLVDGRPVTDDRLLNYIRERRDSFSADDPLYDQWNNSYIQTVFTIGEERIGTAYKQGSATAQQVADFYSGQLATIPQESSFYREVAGRAGDWAKRAQQDAEQAAREAEADAARARQETAAAQGARDREIFDAFKNGGMFEGRPVDDARLLAYITERRNGFDSAAIEWDQWNNTLIQTKFAIAEQDIGVKFAEGKVSASQVAAFYKKQLASVEPDSQVGREIAEKAADWVKAALDEAKRKAGEASAAAGRALRASIDAAQAKYMQASGAFDALEATVLRAAQTQLGFGGDDVARMDASQLEALLESGAVMGADGTPITYAEWQQATLAAYGAAKKVVALGEQAGYQYDEWRNRADWLWGHLTDINAVDERSLYEDARAGWLEELRAANGDPFAEDAANQKYVAQLDKLRANAVADKGNAENNAQFVAALVAEIGVFGGREPNGPIAAELYGGGPSLTSGLVDAVAGHSEDIKFLESGKGYLTQDGPGGPLIVAPLAPGQRIDPRTSELSGLDPSTQAALVEVNGVKRTVYLKGAAVNAVVYYDTRTGEAVKPGSFTAKDLADGVIARAPGEKTVGYVFTDLTGAVTYGVITDDGTMAFTKDNPFNALDKDGTGFVTFADAEVTQASVARPGRAPEAEPIFGPKADSWLTESFIATGGSVIITGEGVSNFEVQNLVNSGQFGMSPDKYAKLSQAVEKDLAASALQRQRRFAVPGEQTRAPDEIGLPLGALGGLAPLGAGLKALFDSIRGEFRGNDTVDTRPPALTLSAPPVERTGFGRPTPSAPSYSPPPSLAPSYSAPTLYSAPKVPSYSYSPTGTLVAPKLSTLSPLLKKPLSSGLVTSPDYIDPTLTAEDFRVPTAPRVPRLRPL